MSDESAFARAARREFDGLHKDQHDDLAKMKRLFGTVAWCTVCGWEPK